MSTLATNPRSRPHSDTAKAGDWTTHGACVGRLKAFEASEAAAKRICAACPVTAECLAAALLEEGRKNQYYRAGVRGGLNAAERAALALPEPRKTPAVGELTGDVGQAEAMLRAGEHCIRDIANATGMSSSSVGRLRRSLGLPAPREPRTPLERFTARTTPGEDGHVLWVGGPAVDLGDRQAISGLRLAFRLGYGRDPEGMVKAHCGTPRCVAWRHLADRPMRRTTMKKPARPAPAPGPVEYLYGIEPGHWEGEDEWVSTRIVRFPITRKTPKRIYYVRRDQEVPEIGSVDRQRIEADGDVYRVSSGWWEADSRLYLAAPDLDEYLSAEKPQSDTDAVWLDAAADAAA
ncbi:WhiB family transcriptional regulator [Streptomyces sp. NPDC001586]|uniref:WhiB family transcriptional regulator n=1 Tax=Streptomyces sp. NPDC001586 TaxID=3154387 RepID=UPI003332F8C0